MRGLHRLIRLLAAVAICAAHKSSRSMRTDNQNSAAGGGKTPADTICQRRSSSTLRCTIRSDTDRVPAHPRLSRLVLQCDATSGNLSIAGFLQAVDHVQQLEIIDCNIAGTTGVTLDNLASLQLIKIKSTTSNTTAISSGTFQGMRRLEVLDLSGSRLAQIEPDSFCHLKDLLRLNISNNQLERANAGFEQVDAAGDCRSTLQELDASHNTVRSISNKTFSRLSSLRRLSLCCNRIARIAGGSFSNLQKLWLLDISSNQLSTLPVGIFQPTQSLRILLMQNNRIKHLPAGVFSQLRHAIQIDMSGNMMYEVTSFSELPHLRHLDLSSNRLRHAAAQFPGAENLRQLNISHNRLSTLRRNSFARLTHLTSIDLSYNQLIGLDMDSLNILPHLTTVRLNNNQLNTITGYLQPNHTRLQHLDISSNQLQRIPRAISALTNLRGLDMSHNQLSAIEADGLEGLGRLIWLDISDNRLKHISSMAFDSLANLARIDLSHNQLEKLPGIIFRENKFLIKINLSKNRLQNLIGIVQTLKNVVHLNASSNNITWFDYALIPSKLQVLDVSGNHLQQLSDLYGRISSIKLRELYADNNNISSIVENMFPVSIVVLRLHNNVIKEVQSYAFLGRDNLRQLDLSHNAIRHLNESSMRFSAADKVQLSMSQNPLVCDCHTEWLVGDDRSSVDVVDMDAVRCRVPGHNSSSAPQQRPAAVQHFLCVYQRHCFTLCQCCDFDACDCEQTCPARCTCLHNNLWTVNVIVCSSGGYSRLPDNIPMDATDIRLDGNTLQRLDHLTFLGRRSLINLFLNGSNLISITNTTFQGLTSLEQLHLEDNALERLEEQEFVDLTNLRELHLEDNLLDYIGLEVLRPLERLEVLKLAGNRLKELSMWELSLSRLTRITLHKNAWTCRCSHRLQLRRWLTDNQKKIADLGEIKCSSGEPIYLTHDCQHIGMKQAFGNALVITLAVMPCAFIAVGLIVFMVLRQRLTRHHRPKCSAAAADGYSPAVFLSYDTRDEAEAMQIEEAIPELSIQLLHRDVPLRGKNISDAITSSQLIIVLWSAAYADNIWSRRSVRNAHTNTLKRSANYLLVIDMLNDPRPDKPAHQRLKVSGRDAAASGTLHWDETFFRWKLRQHAAEALNLHAAGPDDTSEHCADTSPVYASIDDLKRTEAASSFSSTTSTCVGLYRVDRHKSPVHSRRPHQNRTGLTAERYPNRTCHIVQNPIQFHSSSSMYSSHHP